MQNATPLQLKELEDAYKAGLSLRAISNAKHLMECPPCRNQFLDGNVKVSRPSSSEILAAPIRHQNGCICEPCLRAYQQTSTEKESEPQPYRRGPLAMIIAFAAFFAICLVLLLVSPIMLAGHAARH